MVWHDHWIARDAVKLEYSTPLTKHSLNDVHPSRAHSLFHAHLAIVASLELHRTSGTVTRCVLRDSINSLKGSINIERMVSKQVYGRTGDKTWKGRCCYARKRAKIQVACVRFCRRF